MNLTQLVEDVSARTGIARSDVKSVVGATLDSIAHTVSKGEEVRLVNFGTFRKHITKNRRISVPTESGPRRKTIRSPKFRATGRFREVVSVGRVVKTVAKSPKSY